MPSEMNGRVVGYQTRSLSRALAILDAFTEAHHYLTVKAMHEMLGLPKPTISRLTQELERAGYLMRVGGGFELGPKTFLLGSLFLRQNRFDEVGQAQLRELAIETNQTASLAVLAGSDVIHVLVAPSPRPVQYVTDVGSRAPAHATALGKVLLARLGDDEAAQLLGTEPFAGLTANTHTDWPSLRAELSTVREQGWALDDQEAAIGLRCVAVEVDIPVIGNVAISVSGPSGDYRAGTIPTFVEAARSAADRIARAIRPAAAYASANNPPPSKPETLPA